MMTKLLEIVNNILNEELLGTLKSYEVYKNPRNIQRMKSKMRAISDKKGDLYLVDDGGMHFIHNDIIYWLATNRIINLYKPEYEFKNMICWERVKNTNKFALSATYSMYNKERRLVKQFTGEEFGKKLMKKVKSKNSQYEFIFKDIRDVE